MVTPKMVVLISAIVDKMGIEVSDLKGKNKTEIGEKLLTVIAKRLYKVEDEFYQLIAAFKKISIAEAQEADFVAIIQEIVADAGIVGLFTSPAESDIQE